MHKDHINIKKQQTEECLKLLRCALLDRNQTEIAKSLGISAKAVNNYVNQPDRKPNKTVRRRILGAYGTKKEQLRFIIRTAQTADLAFFLAHAEEIREYIAANKEKAAQAGRAYPSIDWRMVKRSAR